MGAIGRAAHSKLEPLSSMSTLLYHLQFRIFAGNKITFGTRVFFPLAYFFFLDVVGFFFDLVPPPPADFAVAGGAQGACSD